MKKKLLSVLLSVVMISALLTGCGGGSKDDKDTGAADTATNDTASDADKGTADTADTAAAEPVTLTVWCWDPQFNIYSMNTAAEIYKTVNPNVTVDVVETAWDDIQTKLTTAVTSGQTDTLPDILLMQDNALQKNVINYPDAFVDLTSSGIDFSQFAGFKTALSSVNGANYGVPFDNGAAISCLRTDVLEQAGLTVNDFTDITWDQFIEKGKTVLEKTGKPLLSNQAGSPDLLMMMMQSAGQWILNADGKPNFVDNPVLKEVVDTYVKLVKSGVLVEVNDWDQYVSSINSGTAAGAMNGCWIIGTIKTAADQSGKWAITNIPKLNAEGASNYSSQGGSSWLICANSKHQDAAIDFLKNTFAGSTELYEKILPDTGALATYLPAGTSDAYAQPQDFFGGDTVFSKITDYASKVPQVAYGVYNYEARDAIGTAITKIVAGDDYDAAIKQAQSDVEFQIGQ